MELYGICMHCSEMCPRVGVVVHIARFNGKHKKRRILWVKRLLEIIGWLEKTPLEVPHFI